MIDEAEELAALHFTEEHGRMISRIQKSQAFQSSHSKLGFILSLITLSIKYMFHEKDYPKVVSQISTLLKINNQEMKWK